MDTNKKIATLETLVDYLKTEISHLNQILVDCGFSEGITTLKQAAEDFIKGFS